MEVEEVVMVMEEEVVVEVGVGVVEEVVVEMAEGSQEEVVVELEEVVKVGGVVVEVAVIMTMMTRIMCLNIRIGGGSDWKTVQSNPFKQTILSGSP